MLKLKDFFYLQRNDRQAILVLLGVILTCLTLSFIIGNTYSPTKEKEKDYSILSSAQENIEAGKNPRGTKEKPLYYKVDGIPHELFPFDPNTADSTQLLQLGMQPWQVRSIYRYRAKGGIFRETTDFARVYGLTKRQYEVLAPYIIIGEDYRPAADYYGKGNRNYSHTSDKSHSYSSNTSTEARQTANIQVYSYPHKLSAGQQISVNLADTTELTKIPGIGSYYAKAIVRYREQLGGFVSPSQLLEIEGLPESTITFIKIHPSGTKKMNINNLPLNQLRKHPYINFYQAKEICDYRRLKGPIKSLQELKLLKDFPPAEIERLKPYVEF